MCDLLMIHRYISSSWEIEFEDVIISRFDIWKDYPKGHSAFCKMTDLVFFVKLI